MAAVRLWPAYNRWPPTPPRSATVLEQLGGPQDEQGRGDVAQLKQRHRQQRTEQPGSAQTAKLQPSPVPDPDGRGHLACPGCGQPIREWAKRPPRSYRWSGACCLGGLASDPRVDAPHGLLSATVVGTGSGAAPKPAGRRPRRSWSEPARPRRLGRYAGRRAAARREGTGPSPAPARRTRAQDRRDVYKEDHDAAVQQRPDDLPGDLGALSLVWSPRTTRCTATWSRA